MVCKLCFCPLLDTCVLVTNATSVCVRARVCACVRKEVSFSSSIKGVLMVVFKLFSAQMFRPSHIFIREAFVTYTFVRLGLS